MIEALNILPAEAVQLLFMSVLVAFSVLVGQSLYEYANKYDKQVEKHIKTRKHPHISYVLFDIFWAPATLLVVFILLRAGLVFIPPGSVAGSLTLLIEGVLFLMLIWFAVRTVKEVIQLAGSDTSSHTAQA